LRVEPAGWRISWSDALPSLSLGGYTRGRGFWLGSQWLLGLLEMFVSIFVHEHLYLDVNDGNWVVVLMLMLVLLVWGWLLPEIQRHGFAVPVDRPLGNTGILRIFSNFSRITGTYRNY
jgi:hypothetical protein